MAEDFEPLFDYRRVQPHHFVDLDDDDATPVFATKKQRTIAKPIEKTEGDDDDVEVIKIVKHDNDKEEEEEDWLPPPPMVSVDLQKQFGEDSTLQQLRLKKQELKQSFARSVDDVFLAVEEAIKQRLPNDSVEGSAKINVTEQPSQPPSKTAKLAKPACDRAKIVIAVQDSDGVKQYRLFKDDKFERFFKMYAERAKADVQNLVFSFDGDKIDPNATPNGLEMEDQDIIEVLSKKR